MEKRDRLSGAGVALVTPFTPEGRIDYQALEQMVEYVIAGGVDYIVALGTTAETPTLYIQERAVVARYIIDRAAGRVPIVLGVGVGGFFDKVAYLAKHALLRPIDQPNPDPFYAQLEAELKQAINDLGIGPQGFGGKTTCLGVSIEAAPTHVASLPVAVNMSCHVTRRASASL